MSFRAGLEGGDPFVPGGLGSAVRRFLPRGLGACEAEWKLLCGTHNLLKLWRHRTTPGSASPATT